MNRKITIAILAVFCTAAVAEERAPLLPALQAGDILLCDGFPKRTVTGTDVTMYHLARLRYSSVRTFQKDTGLKVDGIIGPQTQGKVEDEFNRTFGPLARAQTNAPLALTAEVITNAAMASLRLTISDQLNTPVRIVGVLATDRDDRLTFSAPALSVRESFCRHNPNTGIVGCGGGSHETKMCPSGTVIEPGASIQCSTHVSRLAKNEDGSVVVWLHYLTWDGTSFRDDVRLKRPR